MKSIMALTLCVLFGAVLGGRFDKYDTCKKCIDAGWGWNTEKAKCGAFPNKNCPGAAVAKPSDGTVTELTDDTFEDFIATNDVIMMEFYAPWCGHCKRVSPTFDDAARQMAGEMPMVKLAKIDVSGENNVKVKDKYEIAGFPIFNVFRGGQKLYKVLEEPHERNVPNIMQILKKEAASPPPPGPGEPVHIKFELATSMRLMEHKIRHQFAFFYNSRDKKANKMLADLKKTAARYAKKAVKGENEPMLTLYLDVSNPQHNGVNGRFKVRASDVPCMRVAQLYPVGSHAGNGMRVMTPPDNIPEIKDRKIKNFKAMNAFVDAHFAKKTKPYLRSEPRPNPSFGHFAQLKDLIGNTYDDFVTDPSRYVMSFFYMPTCPHCKELTPQYASLATKILELNKDRPEGEPEIILARMNTVRNDVGHEKVYTGSYPTLYWFGKDKANPIYINEHLENQDEENLMQFIKNHTWVGAMDDARAMDEL